METSLCSCFAKRIGHFFNFDGSIGHPALLKRSLERSLTRECKGHVALEEWIGLVLSGHIQPLLLEGTPPHVDHSVCRMYSIYIGTKDSILTA